MRRHRFLTGYKLFFGALGTSSIILELAVTIGRGTFRPANFFSYFTIESNIFAAFILLLGAYYLARGERKSVPATWRGAATLYMVITGLVFATLLADIKDATFTAVPWDNTVLHKIMPLALLLDWVIDAPRIKVKFRCALQWILFPFIYVAYTLVRGSIVGWYPYPFLNPHLHGYDQVVITCITITIVVVGIIYVLTDILERGRSARQQS